MVAPPPLPEDVLSEAAEQTTSAHPAHDLLASDLLEAPAAGEEFPEADDEAAGDEESGHEEFAEETAAADELGVEEEIRRHGSPGG